jgi:hypothetical protein
LGAAGERGWRSALSEIGEQWITKE